LFDVNSWIYWKNKKYNSVLERKTKKSISVISWITENNWESYYTEDLLNDSEIFKNELTISTRWEYSWSVFYHPNKFVLANNILVMKMGNLTKNQKRFIGSSIDNLNYGWYHWYPKKETLDEDIISLPTKNWKIDFDFMENFIEELEKEKIEKLDNYLKVSWLKNYELTSEEERVLDDFESGKFEWGEFNLEKLFWKSTRWKRLKSADRIPWDLPFVTAWETDEWISAFIWNDETIFSENTITIDMFGSAKYRNYKYWGDDHIAVVKTEKLPKWATIFTTTSIHKTSHNWQFNYGRNFYAKDADVLNIQLPIINNRPDYKIMEILISAVEKIVVRDVVGYCEGKM